MAPLEHEIGHVGRVGRWIAYAAATWAFLFAVAHVLWATGWYVGLDQEPPQAGFRGQVFLAYDLLVAAACAFGVPVALAPFYTWGRSLQIRPVRILVWLGTGLLVLRAAASLVQVAYHLATHRFSRLGLWEPWFYLGAVLFTFTTWRFWSRSTTGRTRHVV